ncbi:MAG: hypothetical protein ACTSRG_04270 [Candidatus Helarchaeota archaeon]
MTEDSKDKKDKEKLGLVELEELRNLVDLAARSMVGIIHHFTFKGEHLYYLPFGGIPGIGTTIYFIRRKDPIAEKYIVYNKTEDKIDFTSVLNTRGNLVFLPIIHVIRQNIFKEEELEKFLKE